MNKTKEKLYIPSITEALILLEASRRNLFPIEKSRLSVIERDNITSGSVFIYNEEESGIKRWSDGKTWSSSKLKKGFFQYQQLNGNRKLTKKAITVTAPDENLYHIINYIDKDDIASFKFNIPSQCDFPGIDSIKDAITHYKFKTSFRNKKLSKSHSRHIEHSLNSEDKRQLNLINCYIKL